MQWAVLLVFRFFGSALSPCSVRAALRGHRTSIPEPRTFAHGLHSCLVRIFSAHSLSQREERILQHKANRHLRLAFNTQFPWIACKKSKPSFPQFLPHECLSAGRHLTRRLRMSSLGANLCAYLADSAPHGFANVGFHCGTASVDPQEACCDW